MTREAYGHDLRTQADTHVIELNPAYVKIAEARIRGDAPLFSAVVASRDGGSEALTT